jgi:hypothetical protein
VGGCDLNAKLPPNKLWELQTCAEAGVVTVPFTTDMRDTVIEGGRWFGRTLRHTQGRDIVMMDNGRTYRLGNAGRRYEQSDFWTRVIEKEREYRIHVFRDRAVRSGTKMRPDGTFKDPMRPVWNLRHGFQIRYEHPAPKEARELAKDAVKACDLDFAAVDVIQSAHAGQVYFLELNTRPGLHGQTIAKYAEKILLLAQEG